MLRTMIDGLRCFGMCLAILAVCTQGFGHDVNDIVVVTSGATIEANGRKIDIDAGTYLTVRKVQGDWLWIEFYGKRGWLLSKNVILANHAMEFWTDKGDSERFRVARSVAWRMRNDIMNSIGDCDDSVRRSSTNNVALTTRGAYLIERGAFNQAMENLTGEVGSYFDKYAPVDRFVNLGDLKVLLGDSEAASKFSRFILKHPMAACGWSGRARAHLQRRAYEEAITDGNEALRLDPQLSEGYRERARAKLGLGQTREAVADFTIAIREPTRYSGPILFIVMADDRSDLFVLRSVAYQKLGEVDPAKADLVEALSKNPKNAYAHMALAWLLAAQTLDSVRDGKTALEHAKRACELTDYEDSLCLEALAASHAELGDFSSAIEELKAAISVAPAERVERKRAMLAAFQAEKPFRDAAQLDEWVSSALLPLSINRVAARHRKPPVAALGATQEKQNVLVLQGRGEVRAVVDSLTYRAPDTIRANRYATFVRTALGMDAEVSAEPDIAAVGAWDYYDLHRSRFGEIRKQPDGSWDESRHGMVVRRYRELETTPAFVELLDAERGVVLRCYPTELHWRTLLQEQWTRLPRLLEPRFDIPRPAPPTLAAKEISNLKRTDRLPKIPPGLEFEDRP